MAKITKSVRLGLTPELFARIRVEAERQKISTNALIRDAIDEHLYDLTATRLGRSPVPRLKAENLQQPLVSWTQAEQEFADELMRVFREEDR